MTELGALPEEWKVAKLNDVCSLRKESTDPKNVRDLIYVGLEHITPGELNLKQSGTPKEVRSLKNIFYRGDLLYGKLRPYLDKCVIANEGGICSTDILVFRPNSETSSNYFLASLIHSKPFLDYATMSMTGVNHPRTSWASLREFKFPCPPLPEQKTMAKILSSIQEARVKTETAIDATRELKISLMKHLFTYGPVPLQEADKVPLKETDVGVVPEDWGVVKLGEVCSSSAFGPRFSADLYDPKGNVATLRTTDMDNDGNINYQTMPLANIDFKKFKHHFLQTADFLITRSGTCGIASVFSEFHLPVLPGAFLIRFRLLNQVNPHFLKFYLNSEVGRSRVVMIASGAVQKNISSTSLLNFEIPLPPISTQQQIVHILTSVDRKIVTQDNKKAALDALFQTLLKNLMTAKIRVNQMGASV